MNAPRSKNFNHPKRGASIKVGPIRSLEAIKAIKASLKPCPRDACLFTLGINTAYRAGELLSLTIGQVRNLKPGDHLEIKQSKTGAYRAVTLNAVTYRAINLWLAIHPQGDIDDAALFYSARTGRALCVSTVNNMVKRWCREAGLSGNFGSHSLRKTWGFHQRATNNQPIPLLMVAFGHTSQAQTLQYLCIQDEEIRTLFEMEL